MLSVVCSVGAADSRDAAVWLFTAARRRRCVAASANPESATRGVYEAEADRPSESFFSLAAVSWFWSVFAGLLIFSEYQRSYLDMIPTVERPDPS